MALNVALWTPYVLHSCSNYIPLPNRRLSGIKSQLHHGGVAPARC